MFFLSAFAIAALALFFAFFSVGLVVTYIYDPQTRASIIFNIAFLHVIVCWILAMLNDPLLPYALVFSFTVLIMYLIGDTETLLFWHP